MTKAGGKQAQRFHEPLLPGDTEKQTVGCRHTNPAICAKNAMPSVCGFARSDNMCLAPPSTWAKQFQKLMKIGAGDR